MNKLQVFYRISDASYLKHKLPGATKEFCLKNLLKVYPDANITFFCDNVTDKTYEMCKNIPHEKIYRTNLGNAGSLIFAIEKALDKDVIYFVEDDYLHLCNPEPYILEGLEKVNYLTLYDHPDKYGEDYSYGEICKVFRTKSTHWRHTLSSCMTFATKGETLKKDIDVWKRYTENAHPHDHMIFINLWLSQSKPQITDNLEILQNNSRNNVLALPIPGIACHVDLTYSESKINVLEDSFIEPWAIDLLLEQYNSDLFKEETPLRRLMMLSVLPKETHTN